LVTGVWDKYIRDVAESVSQEHHFQPNISREFPQPKISRKKNSASRISAEKMWQPEFGHKKGTGV